MSSKWPGLSALRKKRAYVMMSSHVMMALLAVIGCATVLAVIVIAVIETRRMDRDGGRQDQ